MTLSYDDFSECGFPEVFLFWVLMISTLIMIFTFGALHGYIKEGYKKYGIFLIVLILFKASSFYGKGVVLRKLFIAATVLTCGALLFFKYGTLVGFSGCGYVDGR